MAHIVVIDDDHGVRYMLEEVLRLVGHDVSSFENGIHFLEWMEKKAYQCPIDLLITDVVMPGINGCELLGTLERKYKDLSYPILIISGEVFDYNIQYWLKRPNIHFMRKPLHLAQLFQTIEDLIDIPTRELPILE